MCENSIKYSIIIPAYHCATKIEHCIDSILEANQTDYEILVVVDEAKEAYQIIAEKYRKNKSFFLLSNTHKAGVSGARNTGIDKARGEYLLFADSDDAMEADWHRKLDNALNVKERPDVIIYGYRICGENGKKLEDKSIEKYSCQNISMKIFVQEYFCDLYMSWFLNAVWNKAFKREMLQKHAISFPEEFAMGEDLHFVLKSFQRAETIFLLPDMLYSYYQYPGNRLTARFHENSLELDMQNWELLLHLLAQYQTRPDATMRKRQIEKITRYIEELYLYAPYGSYKLWKSLGQLMQEKKVLSFLKENADFYQENNVLVDLSKHKRGKLHLKLLYHRWRRKLSCLRYHTS